MRISVAMATFNGSAYLPQQLASIAAQTRAPDELVVYDDGSQDRSAAIVEDFAAEAPFPVRCLGGHDRLGSTRAFERALRGCTGDVLVLCDQDDVWRPSKLERIEAVFTRDPTVALVFTDGELIDEHSRPLGWSLWQAHRVRADGPDLYVALLKRPKIPGCSLAYPSRLTDLVLPFPELCDARAPLPHDGWISIVAAATGRCIGISERLIDYRIHPAQQIGLGGLSKVPLRQLPSFLARRRRLVHERVGAAGAVRGRLESLGEQIAPSRLRSVDELTEHLLIRRDLPRRRWQRLRPVGREWRSGGYAAFSRGSASALLDLLHPIPGKTSSHPFGPDLGDARRALKWARLAGVFPFNN